MSTEIRTPKRPPLRYHGGKWRLGEWIVSTFPPHRVYVEPFGGGASVLLRKPRGYAEVYNDLDGAVVSLFRVLRDAEAAAELVRQVEATPYARAEFSAAYEPDDTDLERARRLLVLSHMGFGSAAATKAWKTGFRSNVTRSSTVPARDWANLPSVLRAVAERFRGVVVEQDEARAVVARYDTPETLFYCDPPYVWSTRQPGAGAWSDAYRHEMTDDDHRALAVTLHGVSGMAVLSGYRSDLYDELFGGWHRIECDASGNGKKGAVSRVECLWLNPAASRAQRQRGLFR